MIRLERSEVVDEIAASISKMKARDVRKWVDALESGKYTQGLEKLRYTRPEGYRTYCCLGVFIEECIVPEEGVSFHDATASDEELIDRDLAKEYGIDSQLPFYHSNDGTKHGQLQYPKSTFEEIADMIRNARPDVFAKEPADVNSQT